MAELIFAAVSLYIKNERSFIKSENKIFDEEMQYAELDLDELEKHSKSY